MELGQSTSIFLDKELHAVYLLLSREVPTLSKKLEVDCHFWYKQKIMSYNRFLILVVRKYFLVRNIQIIFEPLTLEIYSDYVITAA